MHVVLEVGSFGAGFVVSYVFIRDAVSVCFEEPEDSPPQKEVADRASSAAVPSPRALEGAPPAQDSLCGPSQPRRCRVTQHNQHT